MRKNAWRKTIDGSWVDIPNFVLDPQYLERYELCREVIDAWLEGVEIECQSDFDPDHWFHLDLDDLEFSLPPGRYRIKPKVSV